jgi:glycosyltransferase involved in cell wall biosynthesis
MAVCASAWRDFFASSLRAAREFLNFNPVTEPGLNPSPRRWRIAHSEFSSGWGGQEHRVLAELRGFQKRGCEVRLIAPVGSEIFRRAEIEKIPAIPLRADRLHFPFEIFRLARWLRQNQIQILNTHSSRDGWLVGIAGRLARVPLIIRTRHIDVDYPNRRLSRHAYATLADHVLTTSEKIRKHFQEMFALPDDRISTAPTGIDLAAFSPNGSKANFESLDENNPPASFSKSSSSRGDEAQTKGKSETPHVVSYSPERVPLIGMVSVLRSWKGHATFLEAAAQLKASGFDGRFVIVGEGPVRERIEKQICELNLGDVVTLAGHREDVPEILRALDVLVIPSTKHEGVPQIGLQALACKTPVIGSDVGGIPEIIRDGETGIIFPAQDARALAAAIRKTFAEPDKTRARCERGRAMVETGFSLDAMLDKLDALYRRHIPQTG